MANARGGAAVATADVNLTPQLTGYTPEQQRYLIVNLTDWQLNGEDDGEQTTAEISIGNFTFSAAFVYDQGNLCYDSLTTYDTPCASMVSTAFLNGYGTTSFIVPFEIGSGYTFDFTATASSIDGEWDYPQGNFSGTVSYQIVPAPEPATFVLVPAPLIAVALLRRRLRPMA